jgi:hypothetical protein
MLASFFSRVNRCKKRRSSKQTQTYGVSSAHICGSIGRAVANFQNTAERWFNNPLMVEPRYPKRAQERGIFLESPNPSFDSYLRQRETKAKTNLS